MQLQFWPLTKAVFSHLGSDYGHQSSKMAKYKKTSLYYRLQHIMFIALSHTLCACTSDTTSSKRLLYVCVNTATHFVIDGYKLPKIVDQILHIVIAIISSTFLNKQELK